MADIDVQSNRFGWSDIALLTMSVLCLAGAVWLAFR